MLLLRPRGHNCHVISHRRHRTCLACFRICSDQDVAVPNGNSVPGVMCLGKGGLVAAHHTDIFISFAHHHHQQQQHQHHHSFPVESGRSLLGSMTLDGEVGEELRFTSTTEAGWRSPDIICTATVTDSGKCNFFIEQKTQDEVILLRIERTTVATR